MAGDDSKGRPRSGLFPAKFKGFVNDMKGFTKDMHIHRHRRGMKSEQVLAKQAWTPDTPKTPGTPLPISEVNYKPLTPVLQSPHVANLTVQVALIFDEPLNYSYSHNYEASQSLQPTEALCEALLRRIDSCSQEFITRKDSSALDRTSAADGTAKPSRFEIQVQIIRGRSEVWASRIFKSYQRQPLTTEIAREVILSTHRMVGLFLRRHDEGFVWKDGPVRDDLAMAQETFPYRPGRVQPLSCIPRSYFIQRSQTFESIPGYTVNLSFTSRNHHRKPPDWHRTLEVNSAQTAPLNLTGAESLFVDASYEMESAFRSARKEFEEVHRPCIALDGCRTCRQHEGYGMEMKLTVKNNLGPQFEHLERTIRSATNLFSDPQAQDCLDLVNKVETAFMGVRDSADQMISGISDFDFRIIELRGRGWALDEPLVFTLDHTKSYSRRSVEAILDRVQTGVADMLRGNAIAVRMTAHKRGHFILDKTLVSKEPPERKLKSPRKSKAYVLDRLRQRVERDIDMICKDTCSVDEPKEETGSATETPADRLQRSPPRTPLTLQVDTTRSEPNKDELSSPMQLDDSKEPSSPASSSESLPGDEAGSPSSGGSPTLRRHKHMTIRDPRTGARLFPLTDHCQESGEGAICDDSTSDGQQQHAVELSSGDVSTYPSPKRAGSNSSTDFEVKRPKFENIVTVGKLNEAPERGYETSTAPATPSLVFGGAPSPRSSVMTTPKVHGSMSSAELELIKNPSTASSDVEDVTGPEQTDADVQPKSFKSRPITSPTLRQALRTSAPSPLQQGQAVHEDSGLGATESEDSDLERPARQANRGPKQQEAPVVAETPRDSVASRTVPIPQNAVSDTAEGSDTGRDTRPRKPASGTREAKQDAPELSADDVIASIEEPDIIAQGAEQETAVPAPLVSGEVVDTDKAGPGRQDAKGQAPELPVNDKIVATAHLHPLAASGPAFLFPSQPEPDTMEFSQSKPDFDFSSPPAITPGGSPEEARSPTGTAAATTAGEVQRRETTAMTTRSTPDQSVMSDDDDDDDHRRDMSPDPSEDVEMDLSPSRPAVQSHRSSFGSAGYLGFHEQRLGGLGELSLRKALMRSTPPRSVIDEAEEERRSVAAA